MPRVKTKTARKQARCNFCQDPIKPGQKYYSWSFRNRLGPGTKMRKHVEHGSPKASELTRSKMGGAYAANEAAEEAIAKADTPDDIASALRDCANAIEEVQNDYQEGLDNKPEGLRDADTETQDKIDQLSEFADSLNSAADDIEGEEFTPDGNEDEAPDAPEQEAEWLEGLRQKAVEALQEFSL